MKNFARKLLSALLLAPLAVAVASEEVKLDRAPIDSHDLISLQRGAQVFVNYCMSCHSTSYMRYNRLQDLGLSEQQIRDNLIFTGAKVGEMMKIAMDPNDAKEWFGAPPPDLGGPAPSRPTRRAPRRRPRWKRSRWRSSSTRARAACLWRA